MSQSADPSPSRALIERLTKGYGPRDFAVRFWDGTSLDPDAGQDARFTLVVNHEGALRRAFWPFNKAGVGEAYIYNDIDIEGDIRAFFDLTGYLRSRRFSPLQKLSLFRQIARLPKVGPQRQGRQAVELSGSEHSEGRDKQAIEYHYDGPPAEFFELFLDPHMQYTCGYFASPEEDLNPAQERKLHHVCRKLRLKPGDKLIDFGCGWGNLIVFAAKHYGADATGVTISKNQVTWAEKHIAANGVGDRVRLLHMDFRHVPEDVTYDKAVSVGFGEHLGSKLLPGFFQKLYRILRPQGLYLHHAITFRPHTPRPPWRKFAMKYVFPDGELIPITQTTDLLAKAGFEIRDVESLREHYVYTLENWLRRLEGNRDEAVRLSDEVNYRIFRIYFAGAIRGFETALYNLNQTLVVKAGEGPSGLPLSRADLYEPLTTPG